MNVSTTAGIPATEETLILHPLAKLAEVRHPPQSGWLDYEGGRVKRKRHYFKKLSKALSPKTAAKFFPVENQIQMLIDLQIVSELPLVK